jgi:hypothetical protein
VEVAVAVTVATTHMEGSASRLTYGSRLDVRMAPGLNVPRCLRLFELKSFRVLLICRVQYFQKPCLLVLLYYNIKKDVLPHCMDTDDALGP